MEEYRKHTKSNDHLRSSKGSSSTFQSREVEISSSPTETFSIGEYCRRIEQEYHQLERHYHQAKVEINQLKDEKVKLQEHYQSSYSRVIDLEKENRYKSEQLSHVIAILIKVIDKLPKEMQANFRQYVDRIKNNSMDREKNPLRRGLNSIRRVESVPELRNVRELRADYIRKVNSTQELHKIDDFRGIFREPSKNLSVSPNEKENENSSKSKPAESTSSETYPPSSLPSSQEIRKISSTHELSQINASSPEMPDIDDTDVSKKQKISVERSSPMPRSASAPPPMASMTNEEDDELSHFHGEDASNWKRKRAKTPISGRTTPSGMRSTSPLTISNVGIPKSARLLKHFPHDEIVGSVLFNSNASRLFTGGKGCVKIWDLNSETNQPVSEMQCMEGRYIRSCTLNQGDSLFFVGGEADTIYVWDLKGPAPFIQNRFETRSSCFSTVLHPNSPQNAFFGGFRDGTIEAFDTSSGKSIMKYIAHEGGTTCLNVSPDGTKLVSGGIDSHVRVWDITAGKELASYPLQHPIFCLSLCPEESWIGVGLEDGHLEIFNLMNSACKYQFHFHESAILSMRYANGGKWFLSASRDGTVNCWRSPFGNSVIRCKEPNSALCCDISHDDNLFVTGSGDGVATVYEIIYQKQIMFHNCTKEHY